MSNLDEFIRRGTTVEELAAPVSHDITEPEKERHRIYANLLRAITTWAWNGNKYGVQAEYPLNPSATNPTYAEHSPKLKESYFGHNIAAIAVDGRGRVIDFQFNHNELFNSTIEHAEARLLRRIFSLNRLRDLHELDGGRNASKTFSTLLGEVTVYTTLESCAQCSGIMTLAGVKEVVYLQADPGMYRIGTILRRLSARADGQTYLQAPLPISGEAIGLDGVAEVEKAAQAFAERQEEGKDPAFAVFPDGTPKYTTGLTSFLCTEAAYRFFAHGWEVLRALREAYEEGRGGHPDFIPEGMSSALSNREALEHAMDFYRYTREYGDRGTPQGI